MSEEKKLQLLDFIKEFQATQQSSDNLHSLEKKLAVAKQIGLNLAFDIDGEIIQLHEVAGVTSTEIYVQLKEEIEMFIKYLSQKAISQQEEMLLQIQFNSNPLKEVDSKGEKNDIQPSSKELDTNSFNLDIFIKDALKINPKGSYIDTVKLFNCLPLVVHKSDLTISDIHESLEKYIETGNLKKVFYLSCYKCTGNYSKHYDVLPRNVICGHCKEDIVNVEIQYKVIEDVRS